MNASAAANSNAISNEIVANNKALSGYANGDAALAIGDATLENAQLSGYVETAPSDVSESIVVINETVEEIAAKIKSLTDKQALDGLEYVSQNAEQFDGLSLVQMLARVQTLKAEQKAEIEALRELLKRRKAQDSTQQNALGAAFVQQFIAPQLAELLKQAEITLNDVTNLDDVVEVTKDGHVHSIVPSEFLAQSPREVRIQINADGSLTVLGLGARIGGTAKTSPKSSKTVNGIRVNYVPPQFEGVLSVGEFFHSAKEAYRKLEDAGKVKKVSGELTVSGQERSFSGADYLRKTGVAFSSIAL